MTKKLQHFCDTSNKVGASSMWKWSKSMSERRSHMTFSSDAELFHFRRGISDNRLLQGLFWTTILWPHRSLQENTDQVTTSENDDYWSFASYFGLPYYKQELFAKIITNEMKTLQCPPFVHYVRSWSNDLGFLKQGFHLWLTIFHAARHQVSAYCKNFDFFYYSIYAQEF